MNKIMYTGVDGKLHIVHPAPKHQLERKMGPLTQGQYIQHVLDRSIPENAINMKLIEDVDIPKSREFRDAWVDVTPGLKIDIDIEKARDIALEKLRIERGPLLNELDKQYIIALERQQDLSGIVTEKERLRNITEPLKVLNVQGKINDEVLLDKIRQLGKINGQ